MKQYNRVMLGRASKYVNECHAQQFIGADFGIDQDLKNELTEKLRPFNTKFRPLWLDKNPGGSNIAAGLACGMLWTLCKYLKIGDIVISPDGKGSYFVGEIISDYKYVPGGILPHRREVKWYNTRINGEEMSESLQNSTASMGTMCDITKYKEEIDRLIAGENHSKITVSDSSVEDVTVFALEQHLEDFLIKNWNKTELSKDYDIYEENGEIIGRQYPSDTGPLDILAISKDKKTLLVIELKKGRASDRVVGQIQRYMGFVKSELANTDQNVKGVIIALEDDLRLQRALSVTSGIEFYKYEVSFRLYQ